jgi:hypothetical protein
VAIIPRSFCNGPYYRPFRDFILQRAALRHIHLFESRTTAFKDDDVLQENIIIRLERGGTQGPVTITTSTDDSLSDIETHVYPFDQIVFPDDAEGFIHVPTSPDENTEAIDTPSAIRYSLADIGVSVSTGPVVDFRLRDYLRDMPVPGTVPLLYPSHFSINRTEWPIASGTTIQRSGCSRMVTIAWCVGSHRKKRNAGSWPARLIPPSSVALRRLGLRIT